MKEIKTEKHKFQASNSSGEVSALFMTPPKPLAVLVLAHGAGASMEHVFMENISERLTHHGIATFRFNFPYMEQGRRAPGAQAISEKTITNAIAKCKLISDLPLFLGGKSYGGRMSSHVMASKALDGVRGLVYFGFPLHAPGKPSIHRANHLAEIGIPMLFLQGTRDTLATPELIEEVVENLASTEISLEMIDGADHSFHVLKRSGTNDEEVLLNLVKISASWMIENVK